MDEAFHTKGNKVLINRQNDAQPYSYQRIQIEQQFHWFMKIKFDDI